MPRKHPNPAKLTPREALFVEKVVELENATEAYLQAGYKCSRESAAANAARLLRKDRVKRAVDEARQAKLAKFQVSADEAWSVLARVIRFDPARLYDKAGQILPIGQWPEDVRLVVRGIEEKDLGTKVTFPDKLLAAMRVLEARGELKRKLDVGGSLAELLAAGATDSDRAGK